MIHQLQVLVEDVELERQMRSQCEKLISRLADAEEASLLGIL